MPQKEFGRAQPYAYLQRLLRHLCFSERWLLKIPISFQRRNLSSKCYNAIARFSEDSTLASKRSTPRRDGAKMKRAVLICLSKIGLNLPNLEETKQTRVQPPNAHTPRPQNPKTHSS